MKTSLSDSDIKDAQDIVNGILKDTGDVTGGQEIRLALACMVMANRLAMTNKRIGGILAGETGEEDANGKEAAEYERD